MTPEDRLLDRLRLEFSQSPSVRVGPGDDAAVVRCGGSDVAFTTDLLVESVDFLADEPPEAIGRRAVSVNLSDLAAMGASPECFLLAIGFPAARGEEYALAIARAASRRAAEFRMALVGGDLSDAPATVVSIAAWGPLSAPPLLRSGARPGDLLYVSGFPGRAAAGLRLERRRAGLDPGRAARRSASGNDPVRAEQERELVAAYRDPVPRVGLGRILAAGGATAAIDLSDGLGIDAGRLARASGLRLVLELRRLPIAPSLAAFARREGLDPAAIALSGGDDYEILFTVAAERAPALETEARAEAAVTRVGHAEPGEGAVLRGRGRDEDVSELGYDHLRRAR